MLPSLSVLSQFPSLTTSGTVAGDIMKWEGNSLVATISNAHNVPAAELECADIQGCHFHHRCLCGRLRVGRQGICSYHLCVHIICVLILFVCSYHLCHLSYCVYLLATVFDYLLETYLLFFISSISMPNDTSGRTVWFAYGAPSSSPSPPSIFSKPALAIPVCMLVLHRTKGAS